MNTKFAITINKKSILENAISWLFGGLFFTIGIVNTFWGNDPGFGIFVMLISFVYFLPVKKILLSLPGVTVPRAGIFKVFLGILILVGALGVGELFAKIALMLKDLGW